MTGPRRRLAVVSDTGEILRIVSKSAKHVSGLASALKPGESLVDCPHHVTDLSHRYDSTTGEIVAKEP